MCTQPDALLTLNIHPLAHAVADIISDDLDGLYSKRMLQAEGGPEGPRQAAARSASSIAYLSIRLLRHIIYYQQSLERIREEEKRTKVGKPSEAGEDFV
jgi:hypothetical protein